MNSSRFPKPHIKIRVPHKLQTLFAATLGALCIATLPAFGQTAKPNFSGRWELDKAKSDFGSGSAPNGVFFEQIDQKGESLVITTTIATANGEIKRLVKLRTDGAPTVNMAHGQELTSTTHWQDNSLVTITQFPQGLKVTQTRTLAKNGKVMTITDDLGSYKQKLVMFKK